VEGQDDGVIGTCPPKSLKNAISRQGFGNFGLKNAKFGQGNGQISDHPLVELPGASPFACPAKLSLRIAAGSLELASPPPFPVKPLNSRIHLKVLSEHSNMDFTDSGEQSSPNASSEAFN
jgi:hypothetical protein